MSDLKIYTNHHVRQLQYRCDVPDDVLADYFDWLDDDTFDGFFHYRGSWYHLDDFIRISEHAPFDTMWDGYLSDSFFSGILIKLLPDDGEFIVATYIG